METIELEKGWLARQMEEVRRDVENWPEVLKPLTRLNSSLVDQQAIVITVAKSKLSKTSSYNTSDHE